MEDHREKMGNKIYEIEVCPKCREDVDGLWCFDCNKESITIKVREISHNTTKEKK